MKTVVRYCNDFVFYKYVLKALLDQSSISI